MTLPVQIIFVPIDIASNKRVKGRPPMTYGPTTRRDPWPRNYHPVPDAETRRALDTARREIANSRPEIARHIATARQEPDRSRPEIERFLRGPDL